MRKFLYYNILRTHSGVLKKKHAGNTHVFLLPVNELEFLYLILIGRVKGQKNKYVCSLASRQPFKVINLFVQEEKKHFGDRYIVVERLSCDPKEFGGGEYKIKLLEKGSNILSDIHLEFEPEYSYQSGKVYIMTSNLNLVVEDIVPDKTLKMSIMKKVAFFGNKLRFKRTPR